MFKCPSFLIGVFIFVIGGLSGCSSLPDSVNPSEWYKSTIDFFAGEDPDEEKNKEKKVIPGESGAIPSLSSVPKRPATPVTRGLVSDNQKRKYARSIPLQGEGKQIAKQQTLPREIVTKQTPDLTDLQPTLPVVASKKVITKATPENKLAKLSKKYTAIEPKSMSLSPPISAKAALPANALLSANEDYLTTVVVSSNGVEMKSETSDFSTSSSKDQKTAQLNSINSSKIVAAERRQLQAVSGTKVATILFQNGSAGLSGGDKKILSQVAKLHQERGGLVTVVGHASSRTRNMDPIKHKMVNYGVSVERADKIARELRKMGLAPESIVVDARSDSMPLYQETMPSGEAGNRRAEIYFHN